MKRSEVRAFIKSGVDLLSPAVTFGSGRITEFNKIPDKDLPFVWLEPLTTSTELTEGVNLPYNEWNIILNICKKDAIDSTHEQYEAIVDECDELAQELIQNYNQIVSGYSLITLTGISREPFVKRHASVLSGVILTFTLTDPDTTNLCPT